MPVESTTELMSETFDAMDNPPVPKLSDFGVSEKVGFLPTFPPSKKLPDCFIPWEDIITELPDLIRSGKIRERIGGLPLLEVSESKLPTQEHRWRAYTVATFIGQAYVWMKEDDTDVKESVPDCIAIPWWKAAELVDMPPVVTYSTACLYNWGLRDPQKPLDGDNMYSLITYTGLPDESWFYVVSLLVEIEAAPGLKAVVEAYSAIAENDKQKLTANLKIIATTVNQMYETLRKMHDHCGASNFYHKIRRFQRGSQGQEKFLPNGLIYEGADSKPQYFPGASAAQSSTLPVFDIFFGVEHTEQDGARDFLQAQRKHMPPNHRAFLEALEKQPPAREYVKQSNNLELKSCFNEIGNALIRFRERHFGLVKKYILIPMNASNPSSGSDENAKGTGGTELRSFLTRVKSNTEDAKLC